MGRLCYPCGAAAADLGAAAGVLGVETVEAWLVLPLFEAKIPWKKFPIPLKIFPMAMRTLEIIREIPSKNVSITLSLPGEMVGEVSRLGCASACVCMFAN